MQRQRTIPNTPQQTRIDKDGLPPRARSTTNPRDQRYLRARRRMHLSAVRLPTRLLQIQTRLLELYAAPVSTGLDRYPETPQPSVRDPRSIGVTRAPRITNG